MWADAPAGKPGRTAQDAYNEAVREIMSKTPISPSAFADPEGSASGRSAGAGPARR
jgi:hypothetical protein